MRNTASVDMGVNKPFRYLERLLSSSVLNQAESDQSQSQSDCQNYDSNSERRQLSLLTVNLCLYLKGLDVGAHGSFVANSKVDGIVGVV